MRPPAVVFAGHFPPPVHGMAACMAAICDAAERTGPVTRIRTSPTTLRRGLGYHLLRIGRVLLGLAALVRHRWRSRTVFLTVDAGFGMVYTIALAALARTLCYRVVVQHHSCAYLEHPFLLGRALMIVVGSSTHLVSCTEMQLALERRYRWVSDVRVLPVSYAVARTGTGGQDRERSGFVLGHLANLSIEKGLEEVIDLGLAAIAADRGARLLLGGPCTGPREQALVDHAVAVGDGRVEHLGPLHGEARDEFYRRLDVFVFPSRYRHESFGLVIWEVMQLGVPVIARAAGCLQQHQVDKGGLVIGGDDEFVGPALSLVQSWCRDPEAHRLACEAARARAQEILDAGQAALERTLDDLRS